MASAKAFVYNINSHKVLVLIRSSANPRRPSEPDLVGGNVELGATPFQAIGRELGEETGLVALQTELIEQSGDAYRFRVEVDSDQVVLRPREHSEFKWLPPEELLAVGFPTKYHQAIQAFVTVLASAS
jgi:8-oxo-dGTP pyrophosphatase MutT (NUDIX family)